jgi:hypothetical protein
LAASLQTEATISLLALTQNSSTSTITSTILGMVQIEVPAPRQLE